MAPINSIAYAIELDLIEQVLDSMYQATTKTAKTVIAFVESVEADVQGVGAKLETAHAQLAKGAQDATVNAYLGAIAVRDTPPYRTNPRNERNRRYAGGLLLSALEDPSFSVATSEGIVFGNTALLDARAKQWHRLNYGARPATTGGPRTYTVTWSNLTVASLGLEDEPSPGFRIPRGYWLADNEFYPVGELPQGTGILPNRRRRRISPARNTRGIVAQRWLDAGLEYIANNLTRTYENVYREIFDEAGGSIQGISYTVRPQRRPLSSRVISS